MGRWSRRPGVELTEDRVFMHRIRRLIWISLIALGVITWLSVRNDPPTWVVACLVIGWILMPAVLLMSLGRPAARYALVIPGTTFVIGVVGMAIAVGGTAAIGWWLIAIGLSVGGIAGMWFWFRWAPVPRAFDDPYGWPRLTVIAFHTALVLTGIAVVIVA